MKKRSAALAAALSGDITVRRVDFEGTVPATATVRAYDTRVRIAAFRAAVRRHGLGEPLVVGTDFTAEEGARATRALLSRRQRPTAILFDNDVMAVAALNVAQELGVAVPTAQALLDLIGGQPPCSHRQDPARLVVRGSTAAPPRT